MMFQHVTSALLLKRRPGLREALLTSVWALPLAIAIMSLRPLKFVRLCPLRNDRIGHFVADGAEQVVRYQRRKSSETVLYYFVFARSSNQQWETMLRRALPIKSRSLRHIVRWLERLPDGRRHIIPSTSTQSRDTEGLLASGSAALPFTQEEDFTARAWLKSRGWTEGTPFVCLLVRDGAFLSSDSAANHSGKSDSRSWDYHSYRDSDIETYVPAIKWLNDQGIWVLRMGRTMERETPHRNNLFVDYAFDPEKSDLLDIWLFAHATALISTGTGPDMLAPVYRRPILFVNFLPVAEVWSWCHSVSHPKWLRSASTGGLLSLSNQLEFCYFTSGDFLSREVQWLDLTADEILGTVQRFWNHLQGYEEYEPCCQEVFRRKVRSHRPQSHGYQHPHALIDQTWFVRLGSDN